MTAPSLLQALCCGQTCGRGTDEAGPCLANSHGHATHRRILKAGYVVLPASAAPDPNRERQCQPSHPGNAPPAPPWQLGRIEVQPAGCVCPAGAEAGCKGPMCPRRAMETAR